MELTFLQINVYTKDNFYRNSIARDIYVRVKEELTVRSYLGACSRNWWCVPVGGEAGVGMREAPMGYVTFIMAFDKTVLKKVQNAVIDKF